MDAQRGQELVFILIIIGIVLAAGVIVFLISFINRRWFLAVCDRNNFTLLDEDDAGNQFSGSTVTAGGPSSTFGFEVYPNVEWNYVVCLNTRERNSYFISLTHVFNGGNYRRRYRNAHNVYALAVKTEQEMPYVKISTNSVLDRLSSFYYLTQPLNGEPGQAVPGTAYTLYASDGIPVEKTQALYDFTAGSAQFLKQEKLDIEISGRYIIFYKTSGGNNPCYFRDAVYPAALSLAQELDK